MATQTTSKESQELQKHEPSGSFTFPDPTMTADPVTTRTIITFAATRSVSVTQERDTSTNDSESRKSQTSFFQSDASTVTPEWTASEPDTAVREERDILTAATKVKIYQALRDSVSTLVHSPTESELKEVWTYTLLTVANGADAAERPSIMGDSPNPAMRGRYIVATEPQPQTAGEAYMSQYMSYRSDLLDLNKREQRSDDGQRDLDYCSYNSNSRHVSVSERSYRSEHSHRRDKDPSERSHRRDRDRSHSYDSRRSHRG